MKGGLAWNTKTCLQCFSLRRPRWEWTDVCCQCCSERRLIGENTDAWYPCYCEKGHRREHTFLCCQCCSERRPKWGHIYLRQSKMLGPFIAFLRRKRLVHKNDKPTLVKEKNERVYVQNQTIAINMLPFKIGYFTYYGTVGILTYLLPLHLKHVGFSPSEIGIVACSRSLGALIGGTVFSVWFVRLAKYKHLMQLICGLLLLFALPVGLFRPSPKDSCDRNITIDLADDNSFSDRSWMFLNDEVTVIFIAFSILVFCADVFALSYLTALQGGCMVQLGKKNTKDFGKIRAWGAMAQSAGFLAIGAIVSATVSRIKICGGSSLQADYYYMFYFIIGFSLLGICNSGFIPVETPVIEKSDKGLSPMTQTLKSLKTFKSITWLVVQFCRSMFFSATHGFFNWHIENLGGTPFLIGLLNGLATFSQFIAFLVAPKMIDVFGHSVIIVADLVTQVGRFLAFALISNPDYSLPLLAVEGLMFSSTWSATASYLSNQVPEGSQTEVQGIFQTIHTTGKAAGFLFSGYLTQALGAPAMFTVFAVVTCVALVLFISAHVGKTPKRKDVVNF